MCHYAFVSVKLCRVCFFSRETREGWSLQTLEIDVNGDSKSTNERGPSLEGSLGLLCWYKRFLFCLGCSSRPSTKYFFPHRTLFQCLCLHRPASWVGSRTVSPFSSYVSLVFTHKRSEAKFIVPDWGYNSRLWQRVLVPACQAICSLAGRYNSHMPESTKYPHSGTKNSATAVWQPYFCNLFGASRNTPLCADYRVRPIQGTSVFIFGMLSTYRVHNLCTVHTAEQLGIKFVDMRSGAAYVQ
jgi:hypothetical protein